MNTTIETKRLSLLACDIDMLEAAIDGNEKLAEILHAKVPLNWTTFGVDAFKYTFEKVSAHPADFCWWTYLALDKSNNILIGCGGYKGRPNELGIIELGYEISKTYQNKGFATEMVGGLVNNALQNDSVTGIIAHTLPEENASTRVLKKSGFILIDTVYNEEDGLIWQWRLKR